LIGTDGLNLSVGQKQRLAIAQAFLRDSPILIFDEASSALDSHSERMIVQALQSLRENRTTLLIAHRFSSIRTAQRILYFNGNGSITTGSHEELMGSHEDYKEAVNWQVSRRE
jgi:ABC-type multidrug transport system fused ATPase/permease subunit